jgi:hypothetical protein
LKIDNFIIHYTPPNFMGAIWSRAPFSVFSENWEFRRQDNNSFIIVCIADPQPAAQQRFIQPAQQEKPSLLVTMGKAKKTRKFAVAKKMISPKDTRVSENLEKLKKKDAELKKKEEPRQVEQAVSSLFFQYNTQLGPPYHILVDTNFINFSIR